MTEQIIDLRYLSESQPSLCIPRVFNNINEAKIRQVFDELGLGRISGIDIKERKNEKGDSFKRVYVHFEKWFWNENAQSARKKLVSGKEIKIVYDNPWFWKVSASKWTPSRDYEIGETTTQKQRAARIIDDYHYQVIDEFDRELNSYELTREEYDEKYKRISAAKTQFYDNIERRSYDTRQRKYDDKEQRKYDDKEQRKYDDKERRNYDDKRNYHVKEQRNYDDKRNYHVKEQRNYDDKRNYHVKEQRNYDDKRNYETRYNNNERRSSSYDNKKREPRKYDDKKYDDKKTNMSYTPNSYPSPSVPISNNTHKKMPKLKIKQKKDESSSNTKAVVLVVVDEPSVSVPVKIKKEKVLELEEGELEEGELEEGELEEGELVELEDLEDLIELKIEEISEERKELLKDLYGDL
jgi:hypothetical protein